MNKPAVWLIPTRLAAICLSGATRPRRGGLSATIGSLAAGLVGAALACGLTGCTTDAEPAICPAASPGALVITELRIAQSLPQPDADPLPVAAFVELYNASEAAIDLRGVVFAFRAVNGGEITRAIVRDHVQLAAGAYVALSPSDAPNADVAPLTPTFGYDLNQDIPGNAQLIVSACEIELDRILYRVLPTEGSWALGALDGQAPSITANDEEDAWCLHPATANQALGSPGAANESCEETIP